MSMFGRLILLSIPACLNITPELSVCQQHWRWQNPLPHGSDVRAVSFVSSTTGYTVGVYGLIGKTTDGGTSWIGQASPTVLDLNDVVFSTAMTGTAVGRSGTIIRTTDGGATWYPQSSGTTNWLRSVSFTSVSVGTAVGIYGTILRTTNGGSLWYTQTSGTLEHLFGLSYADVNRGLAVGANGTILQTTDGGGTWLPATSGTAVHLSGVTLVNANVGYVVGTTGLILKTTDGGISWTPQTSGTTNPLSAVRFLDVQTGMACGTFGVVLTTTDGGTTWVTETTGSGTHLYGISMINTDESWVVGRTGTILHSSDGGASWSNQVTGPRVKFNAVHFANKRFGIVVGDGGSIYRTTDGGSSWIIENSGTFNNLNDIVLVDTTRATAVGDRGTIIQSTDGGLSWIIRESGTVQNLQAVSFPTWDTAFVVGDNDIVLRTLDGGVTWEEKLTNNTYGSMNKAVIFLSPLLGVIGGSAYFVEWTTDGGASWEIRGLYPLPSFTLPITDMSFLTPQKAFVIQPGGHVIFTDNAGLDWHEQASGTPVWLHGVSFTDEFNGTVVGRVGKIINTTNGGSNWVRQLSTCDTTLKDVFFLDSSTGWAVGDLGTIMHTGPETDDSSIYIIRVNTGWNIVSVSVLVDDLSKSSLFPDAISSAYAYDEGYIVCDTLEYGLGYWLKFPESQDIPLTGTPILAETVDVSAGWNMVGSISTLVLVSEISSIPPGVVTSKFFGFEGSYQQSEVIVPWKGYWVKASQPGQLILSSSGKLAPEARIKIIDNGELPPSPPDGGNHSTSEPPGAFYLAQNSPNPFNPATTITFSIPVTGHVSLKVYDVVGRLVVTLVEGELDRGEHTVTWDATGFPSGVYLYKIDTGVNSAARKLMLLR